MITSKQARILLEGIQQERECNLTEDQVEALVLIEHGIIALSKSGKSEAEVSADIPQNVVQYIELLGYTVKVGQSKTVIQW